MHFILCRRQYEGYFYLAQIGVRRLIGPVWSGLIVLSDRETTNSLFYLFKLIVEVRLLINVVILLVQIFFHSQPVRVL